MDNPDHRLLVDFENKHGLHGRIACYMVRRCAGLDANIEVIRPDSGLMVWWEAKIAAARIILSLLELDVKSGERVLVETEGPDAGTAMDEIKFVIANPAPDHPSRENVQRTISAGNAPGTDKYQSHLASLEGRDVIAEKARYEKKMRSGMRDDYLEITEEEWTAVVLENAQFAGIGVSALSRIQLIQSARLLARELSLWQGGPSLKTKEERVEFVQVPEISRPQDDRGTPRTYINPNQITKVEENGPDALNDGVTVTLSSGDRVEAKQEAAEKILGHGGISTRSR